MQKPYGMCILCFKHYNCYWLGSRAAMAADKIVCFVPILNVGCSRQIYGGKLFAYWQAEDVFNEIKINVQCGLM